MADSASSESPSSVAKVNNRTPEMATQMIPPRRAAAIAAFGGACGFAVMTKGK